MNAPLLILHAALLSLLLAFSHGVLRWIAGQRSSSYRAMLVEYWPWLAL